MAPDKRIGAPCGLFHSIVPVRSVQPYRADELWGGKLRGAILSRAAHIVFLRIQVKHAHRSDLTRDPLEAGPVPALGAVRCDDWHRRNEVSRCIGRQRAQGIQFENWLARSCCIALDLPIIIRQGFPLRRTSSQPAGSMRSHMLDATQPRPQRSRPGHLPGLRHQSPVTGPHGAVDRDDADASAPRLRQA